MPASALALVILAGLIHACWNIAAKKTGGDVRFALFTGVLLMVVWAPVGIWVSWQQLHGWGLPELAVVLVSGVLHVAYYLVLLRGYREADLTVVYPLARGSGPLLSSTAAIVFLGEELSAAGALGIAAVVGGVFLVAGGPGLFRAAHDPVRRQRVRAGVFYGFSTGVFIAAYTVVDGWGVKSLGMSPILVDYLGNLVRLVILVPLVARSGRASARCGAPSGRPRCSWQPSARCRTCWCSMPCRWRRCRMWRPRVKCRCCSPRCSAATCSPRAIA